MRSAFLCVPYFLTMSRLPGPSTFNRLSGKQAIFPGSHVFSPIESPPTQVSRDIRDLLVSVFLLLSSFEASGPLGVLFLFSCPFQNGPSWSFNLACLRLLWPLSLKNSSHGCQKLALCSACFGLANRRLPLFAATEGSHKIPSDYILTPRACLHVNAMRFPCRAAQQEFSS